MLLEKDVTFDFDKACMEAFEELKSRLILAPIMTISDWNEAFEIMCDASDFVIGVVLGQTQQDFQGYLLRKSYIE